MWHLWIYNGENGMHICFSYFITSTPFRTNLFHQFHAKKSTLNGTRGQQYLQKFLIRILSDQDHQTNVQGGKNWVSHNSTSPTLKCPKWINIIFIDFSTFNSFPLSIPDIDFYSLINQKTRWSVKISVLEWIRLSQTNVHHLPKG